MKITEEGKKVSAEHQKEFKKGKKSAKYGKKDNIPLKEFKGIKATKQYKAEVEKIVASATKEKEEVDKKTSAIALLLCLYKGNKHGCAINVQKWKLIAGAIDGLDLHHHILINTKALYTCITIGKTKSCISKKQCRKDQAKNNTKPPKIPNDFFIMQTKQQNYKIRWLLI